MPSKRFLDSIPGLEPGSTLSKFSSSCLALSGLFSYIEADTLDYYTLPDSI